MATQLGNHLMCGDRVAFKGQDSGAGACL